MGSWTTDPRSRVPGARDSAKIPASDESRVNGPQIERAEKKKIQVDPSYGDTFQKTPALRRLEQVNGKFEATQQDPVSKQKKRRLGAEGKGKEGRGTGEGWMSQKPRADIK